MGLQEFVVRRIAQLVFTFWVFVTMLFVLFRAAPGDPTSMYVTQGMSAEARAATIRRLGLDQPLHQQYIDYIGQLLTGEFGTSFRYNEPVWDILVVKFWNTVILMGSALLLAYVLGITFGALLGWYRGSSFERGGIIVALMARSSPEFWTGIIILSIFSFGLGLFPSGGMRAVGTQPDSFMARYLAWDFVYHMILPMLAGAIYYMATPMLLMRNTMLDVLKADFIEIKKAEGLSERRILFRHAARNSVLPLVTIIAIVSGTAIGGSLIIETVFNWPGMGREMVESISYNDYPVAMGTFFLMGSVVIIMNFFADLAYGYLDPRVQYD
ncbi:ABC transporter permease [Halalkalicoccus jeotgali]|uniref:Binding-protein-dependent transport systems inner membrane component n=1 Tax=Halalkalicoccus jeotgali (strain DSM 18796 / CECT 7217 / JCM 14584 / KCTC 4019 / B3) TaxID=795797 RepID=D8JCZ1_HALJB|nr:ABC transporter permease [Halalkalicoccus jeotgali]ADJ16886.1 binding-protein-dependent transport systems inner membrane component [Halalkalicoccus jeotgali B3]ELY38678.1 binding-protein-dependent transport systems inner membrane component [Halalkalicoccus jeotgali B3]